MVQNSFKGESGEVHYLGATQHHPVQQDLQLLERDSTRSGHCVLLDGRQYFVVPEASLPANYKHRATRTMEDTVHVSSDYVRIL